MNTNLLTGDLFSERIQHKQIKYRKSTQFGVELAFVGEYTHQHKQYFIQKTTSSALHQKCDFERVFPCSVCYEMSINLHLLFCYKNPFYIQSITNNPANNNIV